VSKQVDRQTDRHADRQTDRQTHTPQDWAVVRWSTTQISIYNFLNMIRIKNVFIMWTGVIIIKLAFHI